MVSVANFELSIKELVTVRMAAYGESDLVVRSTEMKGEGE